MALALFDLDNTLLRGDSDHAWGQFLAQHGVVDADNHVRTHDRYLSDYRAGRLDIEEFLKFQLGPLKQNPRRELERWRQRFVIERVRAMISSSARALVESHRTRGDTLVIVTATNSFITRPIAEEFGISWLIATEPELVDGEFTGRVSGIPNFREGKLQNLETWRSAHGIGLAGSWFYSDSHNDLPLLMAVENPVAVNPDPVLAETARRGDWPILDLTH